MLPKSQSTAVPEFVKLMETLALISPNYLQGAAERDLKATRGLETVYFFL